MRGVLVLRNRQRAQKIDARYLRRIIQSFLIEELSLPEFELGVHLVDEPEIIRLNETYLQHAGATDVISFDYGPSAVAGAICGDIFVCVPVAFAQARQFRTSWQDEVVRYIVHGVLHLLGYDDRTARARRRMKGEENRLVSRLSERFEFKRVKASG